MKMGIIWALSSLGIERNAYQRVPVTTVSLNWWFLLLNRNTVMFSVSALQKTPQLSRVKFGEGWRPECQSLTRADGSRCSASEQCDSWLMSLNLWHLLPSLLKVWWAINTKAHSQRLTLREAGKHLFVKMEAIKSDIGWAHYAATKWLLVKAGFCNY